MTDYLFPIIGIIFAFALIKYREQIGDVFGDPDWLRAIGGVHYTIVYIAIFIIFWSISVLTGTTSILFRPFLWLFPWLVRGNGIEADLDY